jgi:hypothetical protein
MTAIGTFPKITQVCDQGHRNARAVKAGAAIKAGMVTAYADAGGSDTVVPHVKGTTASIAGVAAYDIASGAWGTIYLNGAIVYVANADDGTGIDAGAVVEGNENALGGTVSAAAYALTTAVDEEYKNDLLGYAIEDIAGGATGRVMINIGVTARNIGP